MMMVVEYTWCIMAEAATMLGLIFISRLWESRAGLPLYSFYVCMFAPKAGGGFSMC